MCAKRLERILITQLLFIVTACAPYAEQPRFEQATPDWRIDIGGIFENQDYLADCNNRRDEKRAIINGNLELNHAAEFEEFRCVQKITGDLTIVPDFDIDRMVLPWLNRIEGNLLVKGGPAGVKGLMPLLARVDGTITINIRGGAPVWYFDDLKSHAGKLEVIAGTLNILTGLNQLESIGRLYLRTHANDIYGPFKFTGLDKVLTLGSLEYQVRGGEVLTSFLAELHRVEGNVEIQIKNTGVFGLGSLDEIGGWLQIHDSPWIYDLAEFGQLTQAGGLSLEDNDGLQDVFELSDIVIGTGQTIRITNNPYLGQCNAKTLIRSLRGDPAWNDFNSGNTSATGNGYPDCP